jgi:hypothetical protein
LLLKLDLIFGFLNNNIKIKKLKKRASYKKKKIKGLKKKKEKTQLI